MARQPDPPPAPDPQAIAQADAEFNRINQFTPFGNLIFSGPNRNTATLSFTPQMQELFNQQQQIDSNLLGQALMRQGLLNPNPIDLESFGPIQSDIDLSNINFQGLEPGTLPPLTRPEFANITSRPDLKQELDLGGLMGLPQDIPAYRADVEQALFDRQRALLDPVLADQQRSLENRLANRGLPESGEAFDRDVTRFLDARNRAFTDLSRNAVLAGGAEASRQLGDILSTRGQQFGESLAQGNFANAAAQQGFQNALAQAGFNNQAGLLGLGADQGIRNQLFGESVTGAQLGNQASAQNLALQQQLLQNQNAARLQALSEAQGIRGNQFNELMSLLGMQQVQQPGLNNFFAPSQVDVLGANALNQQALQNQFNADVGQANAFNTGLFGLGGALIGAPAGGFFSGLFGNPIATGIGGAAAGNAIQRSDRRLKRNIKRIGTVKGYPWYEFEYLWGEKGQGVMSDEVPGEFVSQRDGFDMVDYGRLLNA